MQNSHSLKEFYTSKAGSWYNSDPEQLRRELAKYIDAAKVAPISSICAVILPHAGYQYSGPTAGYAAKALSGQRFNRIIVVGPSHQLALRNEAVIPEASSLITPLGKVDLDAEFIEKLKVSPYFHSLPASCCDEHSVHMEIPILQMAIPGFRVVPIVLGSLDTASTIAIAKTIGELLDNSTLMVISSDFTHYGERFDYVPFTNNVANNIQKLDLEALDFVKVRDLNGFYRYLDATGATICGRAALGVLIALLPEKAGLRLLRYDSSGNLTGDYNNTVSYIAAAIVGEWENSSINISHSPEQKAPIDRNDQIELLKLARRAIEFALTKHRQPTLQELQGIASPGMSNIMGAFVSLHKGKELRGCIGEIAPHRQLYETVIERAVNAALNDTRFLPVSIKELPKIEIEISALTAPSPVNSYREIIIGKHGIFLHKNGRSAVFLPQVAPEQGWDLEETLTHLSVKAGLPPDGWKNSCSFEVFEATVFSEHSVEE